MSTQDNRPRVVETISDTLIWLGYMERFCEGEASLHARGCLLAILDLQAELKCAQERAATLAKKLEAMEASIAKGGNQ